MDKTINKKSGARKKERGRGRLREEEKQNYGSDTGVTLVVD